SIGEPKKKNKWERRQAMSSDEVLESHGKTAKSEKGGSSFSTDRLPAKKHLHLDDATERAVVQWAGPSGIRLAMNRYDTFDGVDWTNKAKHRNEKLTRREIGEAVWFGVPAVGSLTRSTTDVNSLKVLRLNSTRLPVPMMTSAVHIKDVDRQDFFGIDDDGSFFMPGREKVPQLTVVDVASMKVMEDELWDGLEIQPPSGRVERSEGRASIGSDTTDLHGKLAEGSLSDPPRFAGRVKSDSTKILASFATDWTGGLDRPYEKLRAIVSRLRNEFTFNRTA
ncbi:unnamed protein product, partial [Hapterophycus canaliculatus]